MKRFTAFLLALVFVGLLSVSLVGCNSGVSPAEDVYDSPEEEVNDDYAEDNEQ